jgi:hypothetical protein
MRPDPAALRRINRWGSTGGAPAASASPRLPDWIRTLPFFCAFRKSAGIWVLALLLYAPGAANAQAQSVQGDSADFTLNTTAVLLPPGAPVYSDSADFTLDTAIVLLAPGEVVYSESSDFTLNTTAVLPPPGGLVYGDSADFTLDTGPVLPAPGLLVYSDSADFTLDTSVVLPAPGEVVYSDSADFTLNTTVVLTAPGAPVYSDSADFTLDTTIVLPSPGEVVYSESADFTLNTTVVLLAPGALVYGDSSNFTLDTTIVLLAPGAPVLAESADFTLNTTAVLPPPGAPVFSDSADFTLDTTTVLPGQTNVWTRAVDGKWENAIDWSLGIAPGAGQTCFITNNNPNTVTIDVLTSGSFPGTLTLSNLTIGQNNTLALINAGTNSPLDILGDFSLLGGQLSISNSGLQVDGDFPYPCGDCGFTFDGTTVINSGILTATNIGDSGSSGLNIGALQPGTLNATNSVLNVNSLYVGLGAEGALNLVNSDSSVLALAVGTALVDGGRFTSPGGVSVGYKDVFGHDATGGRLTLADAASFQCNYLSIGFPVPGSVIVQDANLSASGIGVGYLAGGSGTLAISNGVVTNFDTSVGVSGTGVVSMVSGSYVTSELYIGQNTGSKGTFSLLGGYLQSLNFFFGGLNLGVSSGSSGELDVSGGTAIFTNHFITIGAGGSGTVSVSGGQVYTAGMQLGVQPGASGALSVSGGQVISSDTITVGTNGGGVGSINVLANGLLVASNSAINLGPASWLTLNGGTVALAYLALTNGGSFTNLGGELVYTGPFQVESNGTVAVAGGTVVAATNFFAGTSSNSSGAVVVSDGGNLIVTNGILGIGTDGAPTNSGGLGSLTVSNANASVDSAILGGQSSVNVQSNGLLLLETGFVIGTGTNSSGTVTLDGGTIVATNVAETQIGADGGCGTITINSGELQAKQVHFGVSPASAGKLVMNGGKLSIINNKCEACGFSVNSCGATGEVQMAAGTISAPSNTMSLGSAKMAMSGGNIDVGKLVAGGGAGSVAKMAMSGGSLKVAGDISIAPSNATTTASVDVSGGASITATQGVVSIGSGGSGQMTIGSGGTVTAKRVMLGGTTVGSTGKLVLTSGGKLTVLGNGSCAVCGFSTNDGEDDGGDLDASATTLTIGLDHDARFTMNSGTAIASQMLVGYTPGFTGTYTQTGGVMTVTSNLIVGDCVGGAVGAPTMTGGTHYVTNAAHTAVLNVQNGTFQLNGGSLVVDTLVVTNSCGHFVKNGGTLTYRQLILDPSQSAVGDGIPNSWKQQYGLDPFDPALGSKDSDHDGMSNLQEYLAGTNPTNAASNFRILSAAITNRDVRVDWTTMGGHSYVLQTNSDLLGTFQDLTAAIAVTGTNEGTTNYVHTGGATNTAGYYRVRLGP